MTTSFIKLNVCHPSNIEGDSAQYVRTDQIVGIGYPSQLDKKHRSEIRAVVSLIGGNMLGVQESPEEILNELKENSLL